MTINPRSKSKHYITGLSTITVAIVGYYYPPVGAILTAHAEMIPLILGGLFLAFKERQLFKARKAKAGKPN